MAKLKAIFYPRTEGDVTAFYANAEELLVGGLAAKYSIPTGNLDKVILHNTDIPLALADATAKQLASKSATSGKDTELGVGKAEILTVFDIINRSPILDEADAEKLGMRKSHTPPNPDTAQPKVTHTTCLSDKIIIDFIKGHWDGVQVYASYDGITFEKLEKDNRSPYVDSRMNKTVNVPEKRYYELRYFDTTGALIGLMSLVTSVVAEIYPV